MGIIIEFNLRLSDKLVKEINEEKNTLGIKRFEYSPESGVIEFNDNVNQSQADARLIQLQNKLVRRLS
jgi:hypothetical protein